MFDASHSEVAASKGPTAKSEAVPVVSGWKKVVYRMAGAVFFGLGALGALLPGLPATPFLMLASFFLVRTSPKAHQALLNSKLFGPILTDWEVRGGVRHHVKVKATVVVVFTVGLSVWLTDKALIPAVGISVLAAIGLIVVWSLPKATVIEKPESKEV